MAGDKELKVPKGLAAPCIVDWDEDGDFDILCGGAKGGVYFFQNNGTKSEPKFAERQTLIEPIDKTGSFIGKVPSRDNMPTLPGSSWHIEPVDYDGDGDLDLLIGGRSSWKLTDVPELSKKEKAQLKELNAEVAQIRKKMDTLRKAMKKADTEEDADESSAAKDYEKVSREFSKVFMKQRRLVSVWISIWTRTRMRPTRGGFSRRQRRVVS